LYRPALILTHGVPDFVEAGEGVLQRGWAKFAMRGKVKFNAA
jgi:hypothetical protein